MRGLISTLCCVLCVPFFLAMPLAAQEFYLDMSRDSARIGYSPKSVYETSFPWGLGVYWNDDHDVLASAYVETPLDSNSFTQWIFSAKLALFYLNLDRPDASTAGISAGVSAGYKFLTSFPLSLVFTAETSPDLLNTGGDISRLDQLSGRLQADLSPYLRAHLGYRFYSAHLDEILFNHKDSLDFEEKVFFGFTLVF